MRKQMGFTLVEIAVVLVIIGLLLGGVLKGQELIAQAKIRNVANDFNGLTAAIYSYQDRYRALPGDDSRATSRWTQTSVKDGYCEENVVVPLQLGALVGHDGVFHGKFMQRKLGGKRGHFRLIGAEHANPGHAPAGVHDLVGLLEADGIGE